MNPFSLASIHPRIGCLDGRWVVLALLAVCAYACHDDHVRVDRPSLSSSSAKVSTTNDEVPAVIHRAELEAFLNLGPAFLFRNVPVQPVLKGEAFVGYRIVAFFPGETRFAKVDLRSGDVILAVNGQSVHHPDVFFEVWESLRRAPALELDVLRGQRRRQLRWTIVDQGLPGDATTRNATTRSAGP